MLGFYKIAGCAENWSNAQISVKSELIEHCLAIEGLTYNISSILPKSGVIEVELARKHVISKFQEYLDSCVGRTGIEMIEAGHEIERLCEVNYCVLQVLSKDGKAIEDSEFTIKVGPKRRGQAEEVVIAVRLDQKTRDGAQLEVLPRMAAAPIENLYAKDQETVVARHRAKLLGHRTGGKYLTDKDRASAGHARAAALSPEERTRIAQKGGIASATKRRKD